MDDDEQVAVLEFIIRLIEDHTEKIESILQGSVPTGTKGALNFKIHDRDKMPGEFLQALVPLTDKFRSKVIEAVWSKGILDRMGQSHLMVGGVLSCIVDMRERVEYLYKNIE